MIERGYGFRWNSYLRSDHVDDETIELMHESGCEGVFLGMESGSDVVLEAMNKTARRRHYAYVIPRLKDAGIVHPFAGRLAGRAYQPLNSTLTIAEAIERAFHAHQEALGRI